MDPALAAKAAALEEELSRLGRIAVAYSGGVDSTLLLAVAHGVLGENALALRALSPAQPQSGAWDPTAFCRGYGIALVEFPLEEMAIEGFAANPPERCYLCKHAMLQKAAFLAEARGFAILCDGSNCDDAAEDRPGRRALQELQVESPLARCGFTKQDVRDLSRAKGLPTWDAPSFACLYTRFPFGEPLDPAKATAVAKAEEFLRSLGFPLVRVRVAGDGARIELDPRQIAQAQAEPIAGTIRNALEHLGFRRVVVDPAGYRPGGANLGPASAETPTP